MTHFFDHDLPLPIARTVQLPTLAGPQEVRQIARDIAALARDLGGCPLAPDERDALTAARVPEGQDWVLERRSELLQGAAKLQQRVQYHHQSETLAALPLSDLEEALKPADLCRSAAKHLRWGCDLGRLIVSVLMTRGLLRIEAASRARGAPLSRAARSALRARIQAATRRRPPATGAGVVLLLDALDEHPRQEPPPAARPQRGAPAAGERPALDVETLGGRIRPQRLSVVADKLYRRAEALHLPILWTYPWMEAELREERERDHERLRKAAQPHAVLRTRACVEELYPAEPWLPEASGVTAESLAYLLEWHEAFTALDELAVKVLGELQDTEQVLWTWGRGAIQTLFHEVAVATDPKTFQGRLVLSTLLTAAGDLRARPRHDTLWEGVRSNRERYCAEWRRLLP